MSRERVPTSAQELLEGLAGTLADQIQQTAVRERRYGSDTKDVRVVGVPSAGKADVVRTEDELSEAQQNEDTAEYHIPISARGPGQSQGAVNPAIDMSASGDVDMIIAVDGGAPAPVEFDWTPYRAEWGSDSGNLIAVEMQYKIRALGGAFAAVTVGYVGTPPADYYLVTSGTSGPTSAVVIANGAPNNCADDLKLGLANGGVEVTGGIAPRSSAFRFTVARNTSCSSIEVRVKADYVDTLAQGRFYVALYSGATADALTRLGVFGFYEADRTPYSDETLIYLGLRPGGTLGYSLSDVRPTLDMSAVPLEVDMNISVDGGAVTPVAFNWAVCDSGWTVAAEMQLKIRALVAPEFASVTVEYLPDAGVNDRYLVTSGSVGPTSAVIITPLGPNSCTDELLLGIADGGTEVAGLDEEIPLVTGTNYWVAFCGGDPRQLTPPGADVWRVEELHVLKSSILVGHAVKDLVGKHRPEDWTAAPGQFSTHLDLCPWFRLYRRQTVLRNVPASPTMILPSIGERAVMERVDGDHPHRHITSAAGYSSGGRFQRSGGSGGGTSSGTGNSVVASAPLGANEMVYATGPNTVETDPGFVYDSATNIATLVGGMELGNLTAGRVAIVGAAGLISDDAHFVWDEANKRLGLGTSAIPHGGVGYAKFAVEGANASADGPHVQFTTPTDDYPLLQLLNWQHDRIFLGLDLYYDGVWRSADAGSNLSIWKYNDELRIVRDAGRAAGTDISATMLNWLVVDLSQGKADMHAYPAADEWALNMFSHDAVTNVRKSPMIGTHQTSADMVDGFGVGYAFQLLDAGLSDNKVMALYAVRAGGDTVVDAVLTFDPLGAPKDYWMVKSRGTTYMGHHAGAAHDTFNDPDEALRLPGTTSDYVVSIQDGGSSVSQRWNSDGQNPGRYLVTGYSAMRQLWIDGNISFWGAAAGIAGNAITWEELLSLERATRINLGQLPIRHAGGSVAMKVVQNASTQNQQHSFTTAFPVGTVPVVVICPLEDYSVSWRVHTITNTTFYIKLGAAIGYALDFGVVAFLPEGVVP